MGNDFTFSLTKEEFEEGIKNNKEEKKNIDNSFKITTVSAGTDPRITTNRTSVPSPDLFNFNLNGLDTYNPTVFLEWVVSKEDFDIYKIKGFNVYRRMIQSDFSLFGKNLGDRFSLDKISKYNTQKGKFSSGNKSLMVANTSIIPMSVLNFNLNDENETLKAGQFSDLGEKDTTSRRKNISSYKGDYNTKSNSRSFKKNKSIFRKISFINYDKFLNSEKNKQVFVSDLKSVFCHYEDNTVRFGDTYEYYVCAILEDGTQTSKSNIVKMFIINNQQIAKPDIKLKLIKNNFVNISILCNDKDNIYKSIIYKRVEGENNFKKIEEIKNTTNTMNFIDKDIVHGLKHYYRVFLENVNNIVSQPVDLDVLVNVDNEKSSLKFLKTPVLSVVQDKSSQIVKITIFPNDLNVFYYSLKRRDLTTFEKDFVIPSFDNNNFGAESDWGDGLFIINKEQYPIKSKILETINEKKDLDSITVPAWNDVSPIVFMDNFVHIGHIYEYLLCGHDISGNRTSLIIKRIKIEETKKLNTPINLASKTLQDNPLKIEISWENNNPDQDGELLYLLQRRKDGSDKYLSFPVKKDNTFTDEQAPEGKKRPDILPPYLEINSIYYYKVATILKEDLNIENIKNVDFSDEIKVSTFLPLSIPVNFKISYESNIFPKYVKLSWDKVDLKKSFPVDHWSIQRKEDNSSDIFKTISNVYLNNYYLDDDIEKNKKYIYKIFSVDVLGRLSNAVFNKIMVK